MSTKHMERSHGPSKCTAVHSVVSGRYLASRITAGAVEIIGLERLSSINDDSVILTNEEITTAIWRAILAGLLTRPWSMACWKGYCCAA
jgi:hypothetical protein